MANEFMSLKLLKLAEEEEHQEFLVLSCIL